MTKNIQYKVGDKVICGGYVYRIFEVDSKNGVIFFRPFYKSNKNGSTVRKIPVENIEMTKMRAPMTKVQLKELFEFLQQKPSGSEFDLIIAKDVLVENDIFKTAKILRWLWADKQNEDKTFSLSKKRVFEMASERIQEEVALVANISLENAEKKIIRNLGRS